ncbi:hypothetical protein HJFPF1_11636 [Paramyrothecium foliicola]|nr:hypothetical protein HJFPF1_11636 [Paramyrothecium foliicola]
MAIVVPGAHHQRVRHAQSIQAIMSDSNQSEIPAPNSRKERGKLAQREYRKRHANKFHGLQEENKRLRDAIVSISDAVAAHGRSWAQLEAALAQARDVAGLEPLELAPAPSSAEPLVNTTTSTTTTNATTPAFSAFSSPPVTDPDIRAASSSGAGTSDPVRLVQPDSPAPYLNDGLTTLAGVLSWACTTYTVTLWRTIHRGGATTQLEDFVDEHMLGALRIMTDQAYLASLARSRLDDRANKGCVFRRLGSLADVETLRERYRKITAPPDSRERLGIVGKPEVWRSAREVEDHLRRQATPEEYARVQAVIQGRASDYDVLCVGRAIVGLCGNFVCSSDGPRWHAMFMTMGVGLMLRRLRGESVIDALPTS